MRFSRLFFIMDELYKKLTIYLKKYSRNILILIFFPSTFLIEDCIFFSSNEDGFLLFPRSISASNDVKVKSISQTKLDFPAFLQLLLFLLSLPQFSDGTRYDSVKRIESTMTHVEVTILDPMIFYHYY